MSDDRITLNIPARDDVVSLKQHRENKDAKAEIERLNAERDSLASA